MVGAFTDADLQRFEQASQELWGVRLRTGAVTFMLFAVVACGLEMTFFPERVRALAFSFALYSTICAFAIMASRRRPELARGIAVLTSLALIPCIASYHIVVGNVRELLLMPLGLYLCATTALLPWGGVGQACACGLAGAVVVASPWFGMDGLLPLPYTLAGMVAVAFVTIPCADWFQGLRRAAWADAVRAQHAEAALRRMEEAARGMHALAVSGPPGGR